MTITPDQLILILLALALLVVFAGMALLQWSFIKAFVQIVVLTLRGGSPPIVPPKPTEPPKPDLPPPPVVPPPVVVPPVVPPVTPPPSVVPPITTGPYAGAPLWFALGLKDIGFHEVGDNRGIEQFIEQAHTGEVGQPWCAILVNAKLEQAGVRGSRSPSSQSFRTDANFVQLQGPARGAIVVFWRGSQSGGLGHVGFYVDETASSIRTLGGNEGDMVQIMPLPKSTSTFGLVGYWWPKAVPLPKIGAIATPPGSLAHVTEPPTGLPSTPSTPPTGVIPVTGKVSWFGGPADTGVQPDEGLSLVEEHELPKFQGYFLAEQPPGTTGLARRLDPTSHYIAMRWPSSTSRSYLQTIMVAVTANGHTLMARPVDTGPNVNTGRVMDLSKGLLDALGLKTDDIATATIPLPGSTAPPKVT